MALPNYFGVVPGTAVILGDASATTNFAVTKTLTLNALASGAARMSDYINFGEDWTEEWACAVLIETGTAPTAGTTVDVHIGYSTLNNLFPGGCTGSDGVFQSGNEAAFLKRLGRPINQFIATASTNTLGFQNFRFFRPMAQYGVVVAYNQLGQAIRNQGTASNNLSRIILCPRNALVSTTALSA